LAGYHWKPTCVHELECDDQMWVVYQPIMLLLACRFEAIDMR